MIYVLRVIHLPDRRDVLSPQRGDLISSVRHGDRSFNTNLILNKIMIWNTRLP